MSQLTRDEVLAAIIRELESGVPREFHVGIVGYFLDGMAYAADGFAMSRGQTSHLVATHHACSCDGKSDRTETWPD